jgi:hypothetical protein
MSDTQTKVTLNSLEVGIPSDFQYMDNPSGVDPGPSIYELPLEVIEVPFSDLTKLRISLDGKTIQVHLENREVAVLPFTWAGDPQYIRYRFSFVGEWARVS